MSKLFEILVNSNLRVRPELSVLGFMLIKSIPLCLPVQSHVLTEQFVFCTSDSSNVKSPSLPKHRLLQSVASKKLQLENCLHLVTRQESAHALRDVPNRKKYRMLNTTKLIYALLLEYHMKKIRLFSF